MRGPVIFTRPRRPVADAKKWTSCYSLSQPEPLPRPLVELNMKSDKIKLIVAVVIFVVAAVLIAYQLNLFGGGGGSSNNLPTPAPGEQPKGGPRTAPGPGK